MMAILVSPNGVSYGWKGVIFEDNFDDRTEFALWNFNKNVEKLSSTWSNNGKVEPFEEILEVLKFNQ